MTKGTASRERRPRLVDYTRLLINNGLYRTLFFGEMVNNIGDWFHLVALLQLVERLSGGAGIVVAAVFVARMLPRFIFFPIAGAVSDTFDRARVMFIASLVSAAATLFFPFITQPEHLPWVYVLLFAQFAPTGFYSPARRALSPCLVSEEDRNLQGTLDGLAWPTIGGIGAFTGGIAVSGLGVTTCFYIDAATFFVAAAAAWFLIGKGHRIEALPIAQQDTILEEQDETGKPDHRAMPLGRSVSEMSPPGAHRTIRSRTLHSTLSEKFATVLSLDSVPPALPARRTVSGYGASHTNTAARANTLPATLSGLDSVSLGNLAVSQAAGGSKETSAGCFQVMSQGLKDSIKAIRMGWRFIRAKENRHIAAVVTVKGCIGLPWGAADVLMVKFADMASMQTLGDSPTTVGILFCTVGVGCLLGPLLYNAFTVPKPVPWLRGVVSGFGLNTVGLAVMGLAPSVWFLLLGNFLRSIGNNVCWVYATLILQYEVDSAMLGRITALEMALVTMSQGSSGFFAGLLIDILHLNVIQTTFVVVGLAGLLFLLWALFFFRKKNKFQS